MKACPLQEGVHDPGEGEGLHHLVAPAPCILHASLHCHVPPVLDSIWLSLVQGAEGSSRGTPSLLPG